MKLNSVFILVIFVSLLSFHCKNEQKIPPTNVEDSAVAVKVVQKKVQETFINPNGKTIKDRFLLPDGYTRIENPENSFPTYLQNLPLKQDGTKVKYFNGETKPNRSVYIGVVDIDVGKRDLQQCADAVMRLRGEFLWQQKQFDQIHFNFTNGFKVDYTNWMEGQRIKVNGSKVKWYNAKSPSNTYKDFRAYMNIIFAYAGTLSLSKELDPVMIKNIQIGDVFIQGGSPGHAVIVVDMGVHKETKEKIFLLAQSYMPAQDIQVLQNPNEEEGNPWFSNQIQGALMTPEWTFHANDLKRFKPK